MISQKALKMERTCVHIFSGNKENGSEVLDESGRVGCSSPQAMSQESGRERKKQWGGGMEMGVGANGDVLDYARTERLP